MRIKGRAIALAAAVCVASGLQPGVAAQGGQGRGQAATGLQPLFVQGFDHTKVYLLAGAGGNIILQVGDDGVLMVNTGNAESADKVMAAIRTLTNLPVRWIINTNADIDNVGGNVGVLKALGGQRTAQGGGGGGVENPNGPLLVAHQDAANQMDEAKPEYPDDAIPKDTIISDNKQIYFNGEGIEVWQAPHAHGAGDLFVYFRRSDVIAAGDLVWPDAYPTWDAANGGSLQGILDGMNRIVPMMIPRFNQMDGTRVLPNHGRVSDQSDVAEFRDSVTIVRDRIQYMFDKKMTLDQIKAAKPSLDYDAIYGPGDKFIEAVYNEIKARKGPKPALGLNFVDGGK